MAEARSRSDRYQQRRHSNLLDRAILVPALWDSLRKLDPRLMARNPVMFVVEVGSVITTIVFSVGHKPGALYHSLRPFAERGIDLAKIESRPLKGSPFEYVFYLDLVGRADSTPIADALSELRAQAKSVRVLGTYPRYKG